MKKKNGKLYMLSAVLFLLVLFVTGGVRVQAAKAAEAFEDLYMITAYYTGGNVEVGKSLDESKLTVTGYYYVYQNGTMRSVTRQIKEGYTLSPSTITERGRNNITVIYEDQTYSLGINGKELDFITAQYDGSAVTIGEDFKKENITVTAFYSDGSKEKVTDFFVYYTTVTKKGLNEFPVQYNGEMATVFIEGKEALAVSDLIASYFGEPVIVGNLIDKSKISVHAVYNNGDVEEVKAFNLSPSTVQKEGENEIVVSFGGKSAKIEVWGLAKEIESITVRYIGPGVVVGKTVDLNDIEVMATYNDGTVGRTTAFSLSGSLISNEGDNIVVVFCDNHVETIVVQGVKGFTADYSNKISKYIFSEDYRAFTEVTLGIPKHIKQDSFRIEIMEDFLARRLVHRVVSTEDYLPFLLVYDEDDLVKEFPMAMKVTLPYGYDPELFGVYYTPNQKTIMAKVKGEFIDKEKRIYEFVVYEPGAYILVNGIANRLVEEIVIEEELELKVGRNYSLKPVVLPSTAENKDVTYWSSDEDVATVSETGKVKAVSEGTCEIWIEAADDSGVSAVVEVTVTDPRKPRK